MKSFGERNPIAIAVTGILVLAALGAATFYSDDLPVIGGGDTYSANFTDAGGLKSGDDVRIAGVKIGSINSIELSGAHVRVEFKAKDAWIGNRSRANIKIKTLLGQEYIAIDPRGDHALSPSTTIPVNRTSTPIDVRAALSGLSNTVGSIDTSQLASSFTTISAAFKDTPRSVRSALTGLSSLSRTISSRDLQLRALAGNTNKLTSTLAGSNKQFTALINDGALLLNELQARSRAITSLLTGTRDLATQLSGLVRDNDQAIGPALAQLSKVTKILNDNQGSLDKALHLIGPYYTLINDAAGNGRWLDIYICGLFNARNDPILDANALRTCAPKAGS